MTGALGSHLCAASCHSNSQSEVKAEGTPPASESSWNGALKICCGHTNIASGLKPFKELSTYCFSRSNPHVSF